MGRLETVSTASVPANNKMRFRNEAVSSAVAPAAADPLNQERSFSRVFRSHFGITPSELRQRAGQAGSGLAPRLS